MPRASVDFHDLKLAAGQLTPDAGEVPASGFGLYCEQRTAAGRSLRPRAFPTIRETS
jgi:hypothetical protein